MFDSYSWILDPKMSGNEANVSGEEVSANKRSIEDYYRGLVNDDNLKQTNMNTCKHVNGQ